MKKQTICLLLGTVLLSCSCSFDNPSNVASSDRVSDTSETVFDTNISDTSETISDDSTCDGSPMVSDASPSENISLDSEKNSLIYTPHKLSLSPITYYSSCNNYEKDSDEDTSCVYSSYEDATVHLDNTQTAAKIQQVFDERRTTFDKSFTEICQIYESDIAWREEENIDTEDVYYSIDQYYENKRQDEAVLSVLSSCYTDMNGAHGNMDYSGLNFDTSTGKELMLEDIADGKELLLQSAHNVIKQQLSLPRYKDILYDTLENTMKVIDESVLIDGSWYFTNVGITFLANAYTLAPYSFGPFFFNVSYDDLEGLNEAYSNKSGHIRSCPIGADAEIDLNGDGSTESISYHNFLSEDGDTTQQTITLSINNTDFTSVLLENNDIYLGEGSADSTVDYYYIVDLDENDSYQEIALLNFGENDYCNTFFFRYDGESLSYIGYLNEFITDSNCRLYGDGTVTATTPMGTLETRRVMAAYQLTDTGVLEEITPAWYDIYYNGTPEEYSHAICRAVLVHKEKSLESESITLQPADGPIVFLATDNKNWTALQVSDGTIYYLYTESFCITEDGSDTTEVFSDLLLAG